MKLRSIAFLAFVATCPTYATEGTILPSDYFIPSYGRLESNHEIKSLGDNYFELRQHNGGKPLGTGTGQILNLMAVCLAYGISVQQGLSGSSIAVTGDLKPDSIQRIVVVKTRTGPDDSFNGDTRWTWTPYLPNSVIGSNKSTCGRMVNPKYLSPSLSPHPSTRTLRDEAAQRRLSQTY